MSKRAHEDELSLSRTRHRAGSPSRAGTNDTSGAPFLPSELVSQSIGSFLDSPFDTLSRRVQQDRWAAALHDVHVASPTAAAHGAEEDKAEEGRASLVRHALPDMTTTDMRRLVTARVIRALTLWCATGMGFRIFISILPLSTYTKELLHEYCENVALSCPYITIELLSGGWRIHYWFSNHYRPENVTIADLTEARLARFIPFIYPPPHDRTKDGELAGLESVRIGDEDVAELNGVPHEGLADAIALFLGPNIRPGHVVAVISLGTFIVYDVLTDDWHILHEDESEYDDESEYNDDSE
jgi:hypothetical protein